MMDSQSTGISLTGNESPYHGISFKRISLFEQMNPLLLFFIDFFICWFFLNTIQNILQEKIFHFSIFIIPVFITLFILFLIGGYDRRTDFLNIIYASEHIISIIIATVLSVLFIYVFSAYQENTKPSRALIPITFFLFALLSLLIRRALGSYLQFQHSERSILILGEGEKVQRFCQDYALSGLKWTLKTLSTPQVSKCLENKQIVHSPISSETRYEAVLLACDTLELTPSLLKWLITLHCSNVPVFTIQAFHEKHWRRVNIDTVSSEWLFNTEFRLAQNSFYSHLKRIVDVVGAVCGFIFFCPLLFLLVLLIWFGNYGTPIFRQQRVGREGRIFTMYKFRTMCENDGDIYTQTQDIRVTPLGYWLRKTRLDELPQLWNVLIGDMSLIGPRAEWQRCAEIYVQEIPNYHLRHLVNPGITGWAQVNFNYGGSKEDAIEKFQFDLYYIRYFSLLLDISIILKTIHIMLVGKGR